MNVFVRPWVSLLNNIEELSQLNGPEGCVGLNCCCALLQHVKLQCLTMSSKLQRQKKPFRAIYKKSLFKEPYIHAKLLCSLMLPYKDCMVFLMTTGSTDSTSAHRSTCL